MKPFILVIILFIHFGFPGKLVFGENKSSAAREIGKIDFISGNGKDVLITCSLEKPSLVLSKGSLLFAESSGVVVRFSVNDISGRYIRCSVINPAGNDLSLLYGMTVFYCETDNRGKKYDDVKKLLSGLILLYEDFIYKIESGEDPEVIAQAINNFATGLDALIPEMARMNRKYPELAEFGKNTPDELMTEDRTIRMLEPRLKDVFYKIRLYYEFETVKKAGDNLQRVLGHMNEFLKKQGGK